MSELASALLPGTSRARQVASAVRRVSDALVAGDAIHWPAAEALAETPDDRLVTRQLRLVAALAAHTGGRSLPSWATAAPGRWPDRSHRVLWVVAVAHVLAALLAIGIGSAAPARALLAALVGTTAAAVLSTGRAPEAVRSHVALALWLVAAAHARAVLAASSTAGAALPTLAAPVVLAMREMAVVDAALPLVLWSVMRGTVPVARFTRFDIWSRRALVVAILSSLGVVVTTGVWPFATSLVLVPWLAASSLVLLARGTPREQGHGACRDGSSTCENRWLAAMVGLVAVPMVPAPTLLVVGAASALPLIALAAAPNWTRRSWRPAGWREAPVRVTACRDRDADLARVATAISRARTPREIGSALVLGLCDTLRPSTVAVLAPGDGAWTWLAGATAALPADSGLAAVIDGADVPVRVDPAASIFSLLPPADRTWLHVNGFTAVVRIASADGRTLAGLLLGPRPGSGHYKRRDLAFTAALAATAAIALDACARTGRDVGSHAIDDELAFECDACGRVTAEAGVCRCGAPRQLAVLPMHLAGKFRLERRLGRGGMGVVYLALDGSLGRLVALKTLPRLSAAAVSALHAEAKAMAAVEHASVAVVYGLEMWRDTPVLVTEYLSGGTLASRLAQGPLPLRQAVQTGIALADALADLHARGWLHRDIKPSNVGFSRHGAVKLLDFGLTQVIGDASPDAYVDDDTGEGPLEPRGAVPLAGTPLYLSPEAIQGCPPTEALDVWSLALVVFEMIAGTRPWRATTLDEVLEQIRLRTDPIDVAAWAPATPPAVASVLAAALHPDRTRRLSAARDFADALRASVGSG